MQSFRNGVLGLADEGLKIMTDYFQHVDTEHVDKGKVEKAMCMIREGVKVSNRDQLDEQVKRSQAVTLLHHMPEKRRAAYIALTNPEAKPFLLDMPEEPGKRRKKKI